MKNFVRYGGCLPFTAPAGGVVAGLGYLIGALFCIAVHSAKAGETFTGQVDEVVKLPKATDAITEGALLYWDAVAKKVTTTATDNTKIGYAVTAQAPSDATVQVLLVPS